MVIPQFYILLIYSIFAALLSLCINLLASTILFNKFLVFLVRAPGVIAHEFFHVMACMLTGAKVMEIEWYNYLTGGGHVIHGPPKLPIIGMLFISLMPLLGIPLLILGVTGIVTSPLDVSTMPLMGNPLSLMWVLHPLQQILSIIYINGWVQRNPWIIAYLYLITSLLIGLVPSKEDILKKEILYGIGALCLFDWGVRSFEGNPLQVVWIDLVSHLISLINFGISCEVLVILMLFILFMIRTSFSKILE